MVEANTYILEDILLTILLMLPVKSLMRFRSVCKLWYQIISSASFIDAQRNTTKDQYLLCQHTFFSVLIPKEEFTSYSTFAFTRPINYSVLQEFINYKLLYYYTPKKLCGGIEYDRVEVYGICNGLLCLTDEDLRSDLDIILLNPVIRKAKTIPKIPVDQLHQDCDIEGCDEDAALCFGYFDDDYKVIRISSCCCCGFYWVGVYSLRTDCWKITNWGKHDRFDFLHVASICVRGVAYFVAYNKRIVYFDLRDERIVQIPVPETFSTNNYIMEACGESIALVQIRDGYFEKWILKNRTSNNVYMWENTMNVTCTQSQAPKYFPIEASCVVNSLWDSTHGNYYLCGNPEIISKVKGFENNNLTHDLVAINVHTGNLVLLNEQTLDPLLKQETETCSTRSMLMFYCYAADCISD